MDVGGQVEAETEALQDGPDEVAGVEESQSDHHQVERVPHFLEKTENRTRDTFIMLPPTASLNFYSQSLWNLAIYGSTMKNTNGSVLTICFYRTL